MSRTLAYLSAIPTERVKGIGPRTASKLAEVGIGSVADLLLHVPRRYLDRSRLFDLSAVPVGEEVTVGGLVQKVNKRRISRNRTMTEAIISDGTSAVQAVWFNPYLRIEEGREVALSGKVELFRGRLQMKNPDLDQLGRDDSLVTGRVVPIHPSTGGLSARQLRTSIANAVRRSQPIADPLADELLDRLGLVSRERAFADVHFPEDNDDAERARQRLVFDELFRLELALALRKQQYGHDAVGVAHEAADVLVPRFLAAMPFEPTSAQTETFADIRRDLASPHPMHRMLLADVGYGKTLVAMLALLTVVDGGHQGAFMAPTEILAEQHYLNLRGLLADGGLAPTDDQLGLFEGARTASDRPVTIALVTSSSVMTNLDTEGGSGRAEILSRIGEGAIDIVVGTHALIQESVRFPRLGLAVIDEQHRFGVHQRVQLRDKSDGYEPDLLIMTATPIPRTLAMTLYGDLDVSTLDVAPGDRPLDEDMTTIAIGKSAADWERVYALIRSEAEKGHQAFVVCPLVEESDKLEAEAATSEFERLTRVMPELRIRVLHGRMAAKEKDATMQAFREGQFDVLVATTVIEVGIDIPNATVMVIEDANRFGLSQLHQLRGRLYRGAGPDHTVLMAEPTTTEGKARLEAMVETTDGFRIAEEDLRIRGQGTVFGTRQSGLTDLKLADILRDTDLLVVARREAFALVAGDPRLAEHPELLEEVRVMLGDDAEWLSVS
jgi:ATP-dependent DNA helicase RecG